MVFEVVLYNGIGFESYFIFCGSELAKFQVPLIACGGVYMTHLIRLRDICDISGTSTYICDIYSI